MMSFIAGGLRFVVWFVACIVLGAIIGVSTWSEAVSAPRTSSRPGLTKQERYPVGLKKATLVFEEIGLFEQLPDYILAAPAEFRFKWIVAHNEAAVLQAQRRADSFRARNPVPDVYTQEQAYSSRSSLDQTENGGHDGASVKARTSTAADGRNMQRSFRPTEWGGGPFVILNPYCTKEGGP